MIPLKIHYCWFGGKPLPELAINCINSWRKFLPDYEIIEWNESNFDINCCDYVREAYEAKKWAFVSDYARFKILYEHGGLYFDTDVELIKPIDDIIKLGPFMGCELTQIKTNNVAAGLGLSANAGLGLYEDILKDYHKSHFTNPDGSLNQLTVVVRVTEILKKQGFRQDLQEIQQVGDITIYPVEYFCPIDYNTGVLNITDITRSIHHFNASWWSEKEKKWHNFRYCVIRICGPKIGILIMDNIISKIIGNLYKIGLSGTFRKIKERIK